MKKKFIITILLLLMLTASIIYCIRPVEEFNQTTVEQASLKEIFKDKILESISGLFTNSNKEFQFELTEEDINNIISMNIDKFKNKNIDSIHCIIDDDEVSFYADTKLLSIIPTQIILRTDITVTDNILQIKVNKAYIGRITILKSLILKNLHSKNEKVKVDAAESVISIPIALPEALSIKDFETSDSMKFKIDIAIKSLSDLMEIVEYFGGKSKK